PTEVENISSICTGNDPELIISAKRCASSTVNCPDISTSDVFKVWLTRGAEIYLASSSDFFDSSANESTSSKSIQITTKLSPSGMFFILLLTSPNLFTSFNDKVTFGCCVSGL